MSARRQRVANDDLNAPDWIGHALERRSAVRRGGAERRAPRAVADFATERRSAERRGGERREPRRSPGRRAGRASPPGVTERRLLRIATCLLLLYGLVMAYSASTAQAFFAYGSSWYFLKRQLLYAAVGVVVMVILARIDYAVWRRLAWPFAAVAAALLGLVFMPGIGLDVNGARRWITVGGFSAQPSEFAKLAAIILGAALIARAPTELRSFKRFAAIIGAAFVPFAALILLGKDLSTTVILALAIAVVLVVAGARGRHLAALGALVPAAVLGLILMEPFRQARLMAFLGPWADAPNAGYQATQSLISVASGHLFGVGLGNSVQKFGYLPEQTTDMITGIIGEELGLAGLVVLIALYGLLGYTGLRIALNCGELFGKLAAVGITALIAWQALLNLAAAMGLLPIIGVPLPLVSCGGTSLLVVLAGVGIMLNIATNRRSYIVATPEPRTGAGGRGRHGRTHGARPGGR